MTAHQQPVLASEYQPAASWYCFITAPGKESVVADCLTDMGFEVLNLHIYEKKWIKRSRSRVLVTRKAPYFHRYVFVRTPPERFHTVKTLPNVSTPLYGTDGPHVFSEAIMDELRSRCDEKGCVGMFERKNSRAVYPKGQRIKLLEGPFESMFATVLADNGKTVYILVDGLAADVEVRAASLVAVPVQG